MINRFNFSDVMKKILIQKTDNNHIFWGAKNLNDYNENMLKDYPISTGNGPITFKELMVEEGQDEFCRSFASQLKKLHVLNEILKDKTTCHNMKVGTINPKKNAPKRSTHHEEFIAQNNGAVELLPTDKSLSDCCFFLSYDYYYGIEHEWKRLATGDSVNVVFSSIEGLTVFCEIREVVSSQQKKEDEIRFNRYRFSLDLASMAGHALLSARVSDTNESVDENTGAEHHNIRLEINGFQLFPDIDRFWIPEDILGDDVKKGTPYNVWLNPYIASDEKNKHRMYDLSVTRLTYDRLGRFPKVRPEQDLTSVVGVVGSYNKGSHLLWVLLDNGTWSTCVFRNNIIQESRGKTSSTRSIKDDMNIWGPLVREYLPLGFPATFHLDFRSGATNTRLFLLGFNPGKLKGRVSNPSEAQNTRDRILRERVMVSPYARKKNGIMLTCTGYAGFASNNGLPQALLNYCETGIFTTEMRIPARVGIMSGSVIFGIQVCLREELSRLSKSIGKKERMKICSIFLGKVYLTSSGGYPIEYICRVESEEVEFRQQMFKEVEFSISGVVEGWVDVCLTEDFNEIIQKLDVPIGGLFIADKDTVPDEKQCLLTYKGIKCQVIPETLNQLSVSDIKYSPLLLVGINYGKKCILAAAHHNQMPEPIQQVAHVVTIRQLLPQLWLCKKGQIFFLMRATLAQSHLLKHLQSLYGHAVSVQIEPIQIEYTNPYVAHCQWSSIGCGSDYRALFSNQNIKLQLPISEKSPRVLYYDAVLTAADDEIKNGPMRIVMTSGEVTTDGAFICRRGNENDTYGPAAYEDISDISSYEQLMGRVVKVSEEEITLRIGNEDVVLNSEEQLHIPIGDYAPLNDVFNIGSEWSVRVSDEGYELNNVCPDRLVPYKLIKASRRKRRFNRGWDNWMVKGENGQIAVANVEHGEEGDILLMIRANDELGYEKKPITFVEEADELLIGQEVPMVVQKLNSLKGVIECKPIDRLTISETYEIPFERWNWNALQQPLLQISPLEDSSFLAKIIHWDDERYQFTTLDRRCLIPQYELIPGKPVITGYYQMRVSGFNKKGYRLIQNDVSVTLPWNEVAFCEVLTNDETFLRDFMRPGTLFTAYLEEKEGILTACWRSKHYDVFEEWKKEANDRRQKSKIMKVHHVGTFHLFIEYEGIIMYVDASQFGKWDGYKLENDFVPGQFIECFLRWNEPSQSFSVEISSDNNIQVEPPEIMSTHQAEVIDYLHNGDCRVIFGPHNKWAAVVKYFDLTWEPYPKGIPPYPIGSKVNVKVLSYNENQLTISASIKDCLPQPTSGPASSSALENPELRYFKLQQGDSIRLRLLDESGIEAFMEKENADIPLLEIKAYLNENGGAWLPIIGVHYNRLICSQKHLKSAYESIKMKGIGQQLKCIIRDIPNDKRLIVSIGAAVGRISHLEATGQYLTKPSEMYKRGQEIRCVITSFDDNTNQFVASVVKSYPRGILDLLPDLQVGDRIKVEVISVDSRGALVQLYKSPYKGIITASEISHIQDVDLNDWGERYIGELLDVVCIMLDAKKGILSFSRKQAITPEAELV